LAHISGVQWRKIFIILKAQIGTGSGAFDRGAGLEGGPPEWHERSGNKTIHDRARRPILYTVRLQRCQRRKKARLVQKTTLKKMQIWSYCSGSLKKTLISGFRDDQDILYDRPDPSVAKSLDSGIWVAWIDLRWWLAPENGNTVPGSGCP
jgi:hypothetical protein